MAMFIRKDPELVVIVFATRKDPKLVMLVSDSKDLMLREVTQTDLQRAKLFDRTVLSEELSTRRVPPLTSVGPCLQTDSLVALPIRVKAAIQINQFEWELDFTRIGQSSVVSSFILLV